MKLKYITFKDELKGEQMVIFGQNTRHDNMAHALEERGKEIISAGFVELEITEGCKGRSVSLKKDSRKDEDDKLLKLIGGDY